MTLRKGDTWDHDLGGVRLLSRQCSTCIFRPGNPMKLGPGRVKDIVDANRANDSYLVCHQTLREASDRGEALCRGFYDRYKTGFIKIGDQIKWWREVEPPEEDK